MIGLIFLSFAIPFCFVAGCAIPLIIGQWVWNRLGLSKKEPSP